jgi:hypothetical protein
MSVIYMDNRARERFEREIQNLNDATATVVTNVNEAHEAGHLTEAEVRQIFEMWKIYKAGTTKLLRRVYGQD